MFNLYLPKFYYTRYKHVYPCCATGLHFYIVFLNLVEPWKGIVLNAKLNFNKLNNFCLQETKKEQKLFYLMLLCRLWQKSAFEKQKHQVTESQINLFK